MISIGRTLCQCASCSFIAAGQSIQKLEWSVLAAADGRGLEGQGLRGVQLVTRLKTHGTGAVHACKSHYVLYVLSHWPVENPRELDVGERTSE